MIYDYYSYKNESYACRHCGWTGSGSEVDKVEGIRKWLHIDENKG